MSTLPAPPETDDVQSPTNAVPSVRRTTTEKVLGGIGRGADILSGASAKDFGESMVGKLLDEHYQQRLNDARRHYVNKQAYAEILHTGIGPNGKELSDEERADYERRLEGATQDFAKAAGVNKDIKAQIEQQDDAHKTIYDATRTHGTGVVHGLLSRLGVIQGGKDGAAAPAEPPDQNGVPAQPMGKPATSESLGVGKTGIPTPPPYDVADLAPMEQGQARSVTGQTATGIKSREQVAQAIGLAPKPGEQPSTEYQRFMIEGKMPASTSLQLMGDRVPGKNVPPNAVTLDGTPIDPNGFYRLQREPYSGTVIATTASLTAGQATPSRISYQDANGKHVMGWAVNGEYQDDQHKPLPPGTQVFDPSLQQMTTVHEGQHFGTDAQGNEVVTPTTTTSSRTRPGLPAPPQVPAGTPSGGTDGAPSVAPAKAGATAAPAVTPAPAKAPATPKAGIGASKVVMGPDNKPLHKQLGEQARNAIGQATISLDLMDSVMPDLDGLARDMKKEGKDTNAILTSVDQRSAWQQYINGIDPSQVSPESVLSAIPNVDPRMGKLLASIAMFQVVGSQPWLRNVRNYNYVRDIRAHLPDPTKDTVANMLTKFDNLGNNIPNLIRAANEQEGVEFTPFKSAPMSKVQQYATEHEMDYADAAHYFRRAGYKIKR